MPSASALVQAALDLPQWAITYWPGSVGRRLRAIYWKQRLGAMGKNCVIDVGVEIANPSHVFLGDNVWLDSYAQLIAGPPANRERVKARTTPGYRGREGEIHIGSNTHIGKFCVLQGHGGIWIGRDTTITTHAVVYSLTHHHRTGPSSETPPYERVMKFSSMSPQSEQALIAAPVVIEDATAVGLNTVILPGTVIGRFSWVGAASLVRGTIPPGVIASGNPVQIVKQRFESSAGSP